MIQLLFTSTPGPFGALIRWRTASPWSHVDVILPLNKPGETAVHVIGALAIGGMKRRPFAAAIKHATAYGIASIHDVPDEAAVYDYMLDHEGSAYGWLDLTGFLLGRAVNSKAHFCSEAAARALMNGQRRLFDERPELVTPRDLWIAVPAESKARWSRSHIWGDWTTEAKE